ncbi:nuclear transport factor 2 family protein [Pedobacter sp. UBA4863]|uniref:nuclear transport factor 2 family protein n=1 Tax=Pedobacter sp. UBA4863 TaxID=1947060 RepID=UPI0025D4092C|nr:nuclear transport factor 2 family protein [Pedobacter sp. UBA4863]
MKLKVLAILILGTTIANTAFANRKPKNNSNYQEVVNGFMHSFLNNDSQELKRVLSEDAQYSFNRDVRVLKYSATAIINEMKKNEGVKQQGCRINSKIISTTDAIVMAQVNIAYEDIDNRQINYLVLEKDKNGDWKITNVYKFYLDGKNKPDEKKNITV